MPGQGVTAALLRRHGVEVFAEAEISRILERCGNDVVGKVGE